MSTVHDVFWNKVSLWNLLIICSIVAKPSKSYSLSIIEDFKPHDLLKWYKLYIFLIYIGDHLFPNVDQLMIETSASVTQHTGSYL